MALWRDEVFAEDDYANMHDVDLYEKAKNGDADAIEELRRRKPRLLSDALELVCGKHPNTRVRLIGAIGRDHVGLWGTTTPGWRVEVTQRLNTTSRTAALASLQDPKSGGAQWIVEPRWDARPCTPITDGRAWTATCGCGEAVKVSAPSATRLLDNRTDLINATREWFTLPDTADTFGFSPADEYAAIQVVRAYLDRAKA